ncbi:hypothetical protein VIN01S_18080 [Vibrio inusitatus NBRC 102082]|uniref:RNA polymerase sigma-70 domain-containing protein n=1 Tax=Vibrio inusitatus NBRC 102082 TaxID=1219070 RepID=A0A4Y3HXK5_9VIBR|nr:hypothetical protein [Vibrio inusitatus]GEA51004.1 hypothetical protein VIN01S_18080 [Vibrio inusitatus NBRC 102082]
MSASMSLYKTEVFDSLSYYVGAVNQRESLTNEEDFYLSNQCFDNNYFDKESNELFSNRYEDEHVTSEYIEDSALESYKDDFTDSHEEGNWRDFVSLELKSALKKLDVISQDIIFNRWLTHEKKTIKELSDKHKLSVDYIYQIEASTLKKLKSLLGHIPAANVI